MERGARMSTVLRPTLSDSNPYHIPKHRYYELKHFCLQYTDWKRAYAEIDAMARGDAFERTSKTNKVINVTADCAEAKLYYQIRMDMVQRCAELADPVLAPYIVKAVTSNLSYEYLKSKLDIPASKGTYFDRYRKFFWNLSKARN